MSRSPVQYIPAKQHFSWPVKNNIGRIAHLFSVGDFQIACASRTTLSARVQRHSNIEPGTLNSKLCLRPYRPVKGRDNGSAAVYIRVEHQSPITALLRIAPYRPV